MNITDAVRQLTWLEGKTVQIHLVANEDGNRRNVHMKGTLSYFEKRTECWTVCSGKDHIEFCSSDVEQIIHAEDVTTIKLIW